MPSAAHSVHTIHDTIWKPAPPTDPEFTHKLWATVNGMTTRSSSKKELGNGRTRRTRQGADPGTEEIPPSERSTIADTPATTELEMASVAESRITVRSKKPKKIPGPRETGFLDAVLRLHRVDIDLKVKPSSGAFEYFGTDSNTNYSELEGLQYIKIWLDTTQTNRVDITAEYKEMVMLKLCEDEFATFAKENFLKGSRRADFVSGDERFRIQRLVNPSLPPDAPSLWEQPPCMDNVPVWNWDVRPDFSYWLSFRGFNEDWQAEIQGVTYVKKKVACPYFATEFKHDDDPEASISPAINQVASAGCIALYNRFCLWRTALDSKFKNWTPTPFHEIRHFGLIFVGGSISVWVLKPVQGEDGEWAGCTMERLGSGDCADSAHSTGKLME
ncbi:hypothetical protein K504DRAFT_458184 [Pleomassaria siparia CBS 279.74]|uniref:Uncharacterized protein n=1 Tax=Pleomassaria siparia CBS 279.74 TaxID=1314801 RepID=A0A6G1K5A2_9PLEO|nr:hypothetical protein K504DRAFT_458184 [Pleomassaria siparia CBS 279.74]